MISAAARAMAWSTPFGSSDEDTIWVSRASVRDRLINGATALCSTPSYALHLAEVARERGVPLDKLGVRVMVHAGEPGAGIPTVRARIEAAWGAKAYDHPGMTEMGARLSGSTGASWGAWTT